MFLWVFPFILFPRHVLAPSSSQRGDRKVGVFSLAPCRPCGSRLLFHGIPDSTTPSRHSQSSLGQRRRRPEQQHQPCLPLAPLLAPQLRRVPIPLSSTAVTSFTPGSLPSLVWLVPFILLLLLPTPASSRPAASEMLAVGHLSAAVIRPTSATTTTIAHLPVVDPASSIFSNPSLDLPQGDQPVPPFRDGTPPLPHHWKASTNRTMRVQARFGKYLEMLQNGKTLGVSVPTNFSEYFLS